jgi:hypothetical protein
MILIKCLYCDNDFGHTSSWTAPKCPKCGEGKNLKNLKKPSRGDVFGYRFTEAKVNNEPEPSTEGYMYDGFDYTD